MDIGRYLSDISNAKESGKINDLVVGIVQRDIIDDNYYTFNNEDLAEIRSLSEDKLADKLLKDMPGKFKETN